MITDKSRALIMQQAIINYIDIDEYLEGELTSNVRHEYYDGQIYAMAGAGEKHNLICLNVASALRQKCRGSQCRTFIADMKLFIEEYNRFYYPDILLVCNPNDNHEYYKQTPCLIVEVLSPSTETIDRREKLHSYQTIDSVQEYVLISQETQSVELYRREAGYWVYFLLNEPEDQLTLKCLDLNIPMQTIYEDVVMNIE